MIFSTSTFGKNMSISLAIVEDLDEVREGLKQFISLNPEFKVLDTYKSAEEGIYEIPLVKPDIVIMDISLPGMSGIESRRIGLSSEEYRPDSNDRGIEGTAQWRFTHECQYCPQTGKSIS